MDSAISFNSPPTTDAFTAFNGSQVALRITNVLGFGRLVITVSGKLEGAVQPAWLTVCVDDVGVDYGWLDARSGRA